MSAAVCDVHLCRGCCCGTERKHPDVDHGAQERMLTALCGELPGVRVDTTDCLGPCSQSNVVVIKAPRSRPVWVGGVLTPALTLQLCVWIRRGGPASGALPSAIVERIFDPVAERDARLREGAAQATITRQDSLSLPMIDH